VFGFAIVGSIVVVTVASIAFMFWADRRRRRKLFALPRTKIADVVGGERVRIVGIARKLADDVGAAYSGTVCLACKCWASAGGDGDTPDDVIRVVPFRVEDDTGSIDIGSSIRSSSSPAT
jgi:hypothetical protein